MKVVFLLTYPLYHDGWTTEDWLSIENRDRWMPGVVAEKGHEVELWAGAQESSRHTSRLAGFPDYPIRLFETDQRGGRTKFHRSPALVAHAQQHPADLYLLKGVDGGLGEELLEEYLLPATKPFAYIVGGKYRGRQVRQAVATLYETDYQAERLAHPRLPWRHAIPTERLIRLSKSVDTDVFCPQGEPKRYDVLAVSRLDRRNKRFEELGALSEQLRVAVIGGGPDEQALRAEYPRVEWMGRQPNAEVPRWMSRARVVLHNSLRERRPTRDFYPRAIAETLACGVPAVGFRDIIAPDVLPERVGLRVGRETVVEETQALLADEPRLREMAEAARSYAVAHLGKRSSLPAIDALFQLLESGQ